MSHGCLLGGPVYFQTRIILILYSFLEHKGAPRDSAVLGVSDIVTFSFLPATSRMCKAGGQVFWYRIGTNFLLP